jgi:hypothetical protein
MIGKVLAIAAVVLGILAALSVSLGSLDGAQLAGAAAACAGGALLL